ncbi:hypothetical protein Tco_0915883 [Tanacetum coccineum]
MDQKSTSGACQILRGKLVCWSAKKQQSVAMSSVKAEIVAATGCCANILWMKSQLSDYDIHYKMVPIFCDNTSAIVISNNPVLHSRTKHIDIRKFQLSTKCPSLQANLQVLNELPTEKGLYKMSSVLYQNFLREFWCTEIAYDPNPHADETQSGPLKEYLIKFSAMNGKKPLTLDFKTFTTSTSLDYNNGEYVAHPSPEAVLSENYSSTEQINYIQQMIAYCHITRIKVDIGEIIYNDLITKLIKRNIQLAGTGLPSTQLDEGTRKSQPLPESTTINPKDSGGNVQPAEKGLPSTASDEGMVKTTPLPEGPRGDKDSKGLKPPADMEPLTNPIADTLRTGAKYQVDETQSTRLSDEDDVLEAGEEMDEDIPPTDEEAQSPPQTKNILNHLMHKNSLINQTLTPLSLLASIEDYYDENVDHKDQTNKLVKETMKTLDNISKVGIDERAKLLKALNRVSETLEADSTLKEEMKKMVESYNTTSGNLLGLTKLVNNVKLLELLTKLEGF